MQVHELIARLESMPSDATVLIASQPSWPLATTVEGAVEHATVLEAGDDPDDDDGPETPHANVVWLAAGDHPDERTWDSPYAPGDVWDAANGGW